MQSKATAEKGWLFCFMAGDLKKSKPYKFVGFVNFCRNLKKINIFGWGGNCGSGQMVAIPERH
jgi:hypothetical protein